MSQFSSDFNSAPLNDIFEHSANEKQEVESCFFKNIKITIPNYITKSIANSSEHFTKEKKRVDQEHKLINLFVRPRIFHFKLPINITFIRVSSRQFDDDNLIISFKNMRDKIAQLFFPGTKIGRADGKKCFKWNYAQQKGLPKEKKTIIFIEEIGGIALY